MDRSSEIGLSNELGHSAIFAGALRPIPPEQRTYHLAPKDSGASGVFLVDMKALQCLLFELAIGGVLLGVSVGAQPLGKPIPPRPLPVAGEAEPPKRFDLDFKGGMPKDLVDAVERASGMPANVIIPEEHQDFFLPPLKLRNVTVPQLFETLAAASHKTENRYFGNSVSRVSGGYGFRTADRSSGANSIWYFYVDDPGGERAMPPPAPQCRFWQLEPYLEKFKVEDITTAIETGWKMLGVNPLPKLTFHKDTKLLVVVGQTEQLRTVDDVLRELAPATGPSEIDPATGLPVNKSAKGSGQVPGEKPSRR